MTKTSKHRWGFSRYFRSGAYGWKGTALASRRIKQAISEIRKVGKQDPSLAAEGAIELMGRFWPALEHIDSSSGALGSAVYSALLELIPIIVDAPAETRVREKWLEDLWVKAEEDGVDFLGPVLGRWGELCRTKELATKWIERLLFPVRRTFQDKSSFTYFRGTTACLSCLLLCERYEELIEILEISGRPFWPYRQFGVRALLAMGKSDEALAYAEANRGGNYSEWQIDQMCQEILFSQGRFDEAYRKYALTANKRTSNLATFKAVAQKYPMIGNERILSDLIASTPGEEGKWFATAKSLGLFECALDLIAQSPCDPKTLNRAARDFLESNPEFSLNVAMASLRWIAEGYGYEITGLDVYQAHTMVLDVAKKLGREPETRAWISALIDSPTHPGNFVSRVLGKA